METNPFALRPQLLVMTTCPMEPIPNETSIAEVINTKLTTWETNPPEIHRSRSLQHWPKLNSILKFFCSQASVLLPPSKWHKNTTLQTYSHCLTNCSFLPSLQPSHRILIRFSILLTHFSCDSKKRTKVGKAFQNQLQKCKPPFSV